VGDVGRDVAVWTDRLTYDTFSGMNIYVQQATEKFSQLKRSLPVQHEVSNGLEQGLPTVGDMDKYSFPPFVSIQNSIQHLQTPTASPPSSLIAFGFRGDPSD
jgi:hypothetical protein